MKKFILGTAGHVDHGKTALVRALTGIECDTHKEEKARGITINLGFAHLELEGGVSFGIVDVPGHRDFIHTMVSGASGIDIAMLVVAADSGVMPQTIEHLEIMQVLGVRSGLVALNKADLVEPDMIDLATEELRDLLKGTFLEDCPIVPVSAITGAGLDQLKQALAVLTDKMDEKSTGEVFRLYPDRIFSVAGFGSVVTGSVLGGVIRTGDPAFLLPSGKKLRVRRIERHGEEVAQVSAGDRASLNLVGLDKEDFERGMVISDRLLSGTLMVDAYLELFAHAREFGTWTQVAFHLATYERQAKIHLLSPERLPSGERGLVQIHLDSPCILQYGDRFVIRASSSDVTLGGGEIIDPAPLHHRRKTEKLVTSLARVAEGRLPELIAVELRKHRGPRSTAELAAAFNIAAADIERLVSETLPPHLLHFAAENKMFLALREDHEALAARLLDTLADHHAQNPLDDRGRTAEELMGALGIKRGTSAETVFRLLLPTLKDANQIRAVEHSYVLVGHTVALTKSQSEAIAAIETQLRASGVNTQSANVLKDAVAAVGIGENDLKQYLRYLVSMGKAVAIEGEFIHTHHVDQARQKLLRALKDQPDGMTVGQFRDLSGGSRRSSILLFELFETEGFVSRVKDIRIISPKGLAALR